MKACFQPHPNKYRRSHLTPPYGRPSRVALLLGRDVVSLAVAFTRPSADALARCHGTVGSILSYEMAFNQPACRLSCTSFSLSQG